MCQLQCSSFKDTLISRHNRLSKNLIKSLFYFCFSRRVPTFNLVSKHSESFDKLLLCSQNAFEFNFLFFWLAVFAKLSHNPCYGPPYNALSPCKSFIHGLWLFIRFLMSLLCSFVYGPAFKSLFNGYLWKRQTFHDEFIFHLLSHFCNH